MLKRDKAMFDAVRMNDVAALMAALAAGANPNRHDVNDRLPLYYAVGLPDFKILDTLLAQGANPDLPDERGYTPLMHAVAELDFTAATMMLQAGANINTQAKVGGLTPLHSAAFADMRDGGKTRVQFVLKQKPDLGLTLSWKETYFTALDLARDARDETIVALIEREIARRAKAAAVAAARAARAADKASDAADAKLHARLQEQGRIHRAKLRL